MAVRITNLVMGKICYKDKMRNQTFQKIGFGHWTVDTNSYEEVWNLSSVKAIYSIPYAVENQTLNLMLYKY